MSAASDAVVVGSGPNGLVAAIELARAGVATTVIEASTTLGGGAQSASLTVPGFIHDICATAFSIAPVSPAFHALDVHWLHAPFALAHPLSDGRCAAIAHDLEDTARSLDVDAHAYEKLIAPLVADANVLWPELLRPLHMPTTKALLRFGAHVLAAPSADRFARAHFDGDEARALFAGCAQHSFLPPTSTGTTAMGLAMMLAAHTPGWPFAEGGAQSITDALVNVARSLGVTFVTDWRVRSVDELPKARAYLFDVDPHQLLSIAAARFTPRYRRALARYRYGPAAFKVDWALTAPIPWRAPVCRDAAVVHVGGTLDEMSASETAVSVGELPEKLFVLVAQPTRVDPHRAPLGRHIAWAYAHVPHGCTVDVTDAIEARIDEFAPGFRDVILARSSMSPAAIERHNANCVGGHIVGGVPDARQLFFRPSTRAVPYATPDPAIFLCSSSTPPGAGVHGMCGFHAAHVALARRFHIYVDSDHDDARNADRNAVDDATRSAGTSL